MDYNELIDIIREENKKITEKLGDIVKIQMNPLYKYKRSIGAGLVKYAGKPCRTCKEFYLGIRNEKECEKCLTN